MPTEQRGTAVGGHQTCSSEYPLTARLHTDKENSSRLKTFSNRLKKWQNAAPNSWLKHHGHPCSHELVLSLRGSRVQQLGPLGAAFQTRVKSTYCTSVHRLVGLCEVIYSIIFNKHDAKCLSVEMNTENSHFINLYQTLVLLEEEKPTESCHHEKHCLDSSCFLSSMFYVSGEKQKLLICNIKPFTCWLLGITGQNTKK